MLKLKYIGPSFGIDELTNGKIYEATIEKIGNDELYRVIDDSGEDYLYQKDNPGPTDGSCHGRWEIIEE